ncbi:MAG: hypothetical protein Q9187_006278, partial [Circinaria calcarea]
IVNSASIIHVSFVPSPDDPFPTTLPMLGHMGNFSSPDADPATEPLDLYIHGYISSRLMRLPENAPERIDTEESGLPVCVSAAHLDGIVLALTPFHNSMNYRSAVLHGYAQPVTGAEEKLWAMQLITEGILPGGWNNARVPPTQAELQSTQILRVRVKSASAKVRAGGPSEDRKDLKDAELRKRVWTGVVPVWEMWGEPIKAEENEKEGGLPEYIRRVEESGNEARRSHAERAVKET